MNEKKNNNVTTAIYESAYTGHTSGYISHLMKFINSRPDLHNKYLFILNELMRDLLGELITSQHYQIKFIVFEKKITNAVKRSFWEWKLFEKIIQEQKSLREIILMNIDSYLVLLVTRRFKKYNLAVKGILFQPYLHFKENKGGFTFLLKKVYKNYLFQKYSVLLNSKIVKVFILNDRTTVGVMNKKIKNVFYNLPDPIERDVRNRDQNNYKNILDKYGVKTTNKNLLVFGSIDYRKNLINIIDSLRLLPPELKKNVHLIVAGKISIASYKQHIEKHKDEISIGYNDGFVNADEREPLFESCDLVLMPYRNFYSASSVLGHAISYNKNVVAPNKGLLGKTVKESKVGIVVDPLKPEEIKQAIIDLLSKPSEYNYDGNALIEEYSAINFSKSLLLN